MSEQQFDVFLAHSSKDKLLIRQIYSQLKERGIKPWLDEEEIAPGTPFQDAIQRAISQVETAAIFIGEEGLGQWQTLELRTLISQCVKRGIPIIPVLLPGVQSIPENYLFLQEYRFVRLGQKLDEYAIEQLEWGITGRKPAKSADEPVNSAAIFGSSDADIREKQVYEKSSAQPEIKSFTFEYITIESQKSGLFSFREKTKINKKRKQAKCFLEDLSGGIELEMILISQGKFWTSDSSTDIGSFFMSKYPITQAQWKAVSCLTTIDHKLEPLPSKFQGSDLPVECISWHEAVEFCKRLSFKFGREYRLPTELEWEYACRAGTTTNFHFGDVPDPKFANFRDEQNSNQSANSTMPVGKFECPNSYGLYDMHGNVYEWCLDKWRTKPNSSVSLEKMKQNLDKIGARVVRGGSWADYPVGCQCSSRKRMLSEEKTEFLGFRVVYPTKLNSVN